MSTAQILHTSYEQQNLLQQGSESDTFTLERYQQFYRFFPSGGKRILDVGCNTGRGGMQLKKVDPSLKICGLDCVRERLAGLPDCYDAGMYGLSTEIPAEDGSFDVIVAGEFLEHLYPGDVDRTICEFQRVLAVGGRLLITTPNPSYLKNRFDGGTVYGVSHLSQHFPSVLRFRLKMHGFSHIRVLGSGRMTRYIGYYFPFLPVYGSYLAIGDKI